MILSITILYLINLTITTLCIMTLIIMILRIIIFSIVIVSIMIEWITMILNSTNFYYTRHKHYLPSFFKRVPSKYPGFIALVFLGTLHKR